jgi:hypothetical protein
LCSLQEAYPEIGMELDVPSRHALRTNLPMPYWQDLHLTPCGRNRHSPRPPSASDRHCTWATDMEE